MDELEFRRRLYADPTDDAVLKAAEQSPQFKAELDDVLAFEKVMQHATHVPVPTGLAERLMLHANEDAVDETPKENGEDTVQDNVVQLSWYRRHLAPFAMAASIFIAMTLYLFSASPTGVHANEYAFEHINHELGAFKYTAEVSIDKVNDKLATFGAKLEDVPGKVTYATYCNYLGKKSLHLIYQSDSGPVTVFFVPRDNSFKEKSRAFFNEQFSGLLSPLDKADVILVANLHSPVEQFAESFTRRLTWL